MPSPACPGNPDPPPLPSPANRAGEGGGRDNPGGRDKAGHDLAWWFDMSEMNSNPAIVNLLPENAPFAPEQRIWLSGLFAGLLGIDQAVMPLSAEEAAALVPGLHPEAVVAPAEAPVTWH